MIIGHNDCYIEMGKVEGEYKFIWIRMHYSENGYTVDSSIDGLLTDDSFETRKKWNEFRKFVIRELPIKLSYKGEIVFKYDTYGNVRISLSLRGRQTEDDVCANCGVTVVGEYRESVFDELETLLFQKVG